MLSVSKRFLLCGRYSAKQSVSFTVMLKKILEILAKQIFMGLRYVHRKFCIP